MGNAELNSVEIMLHEFGHHVLHENNPAIAAQYNPDHPFVRGILEESYADLMGAAIALRSPSISGHVGNPWIHGDGPSYVGAARDFNNTYTFRRLSDATLTPHQRGQAISNYFFKIKTTSGYIRTGASSSYCCRWGTASTISMATASTSSI